MKFFPALISAGKRASTKGHASDTNDANIDDIIIYQKAGTDTQVDDLAVVVLEDYSAPLTVDDFIVL